MNYFPFFRGKQFELICLRENAELIADAGFTVIIEPVKESANGLLRAIEALKEANAKLLVVANPSVGHHADSLSDDFFDLVNASIVDFAGAGWIFQIRESDDLDDLQDWLGRSESLAVFHQGTVPPKKVAGALGDDENQKRIHVFSENCSARYRGIFESDQKILLIDEFNKQNKNADYPEVELFSELPVTYRDQGANGFGDYLMVGREYAEGGGAAYAVAIHITYADPDDDGVIYIRHFLSDTNNTPTDPAGKFREALSKLISFCDEQESKIPETSAIEEFRKLNASGHFPGLGYVKKLSMQHHLEVMAE